MAQLYGDGQWIYDKDTWEMKKDPNLNCQTASSLRDQNVAQDQAIRDSSSCRQYAILTPSQKQYCPVPYYDSD